MEILISYDLNSKQGEMKSELIKLGYSDQWISEGVTYYLPNTTLWKAGSTLENGKTDMVKTAQKLNVVLERAIVTPCDGWAGIPGKPHTR